MNIFHSIILGAVEGLTEFVPVSSSGHLIIAHYLLGDSNVGGLTFDAIVQFATILAVFVYFFKDLWKVFMTFIALVMRKTVEQHDKVMLYAIILGTIPAGIFGLLLEKKMETTFRSVEFVAITLILGSVLMIWAEWYTKKHAAEQSKELTVRKGIWVGFFQVLALAPGISRSGATISGGLLNGFSRELATRFSFLLAFPIIFGSGLKKLHDMYKASGADTVVSSFGTTDIIIGSVVAFIVGLAAIHLLITYLKRHTLYPFIWYRIVVAVILLVYFV